MFQIGSFLNSHFVKLNQFFRSSFCRSSCQFFQFSQLLLAFMILYFFGLTYPCLLSFPLHCLSNSHTFETFLLHLTELFSLCDNSFTHSLKVSNLLLKRSLGLKPFRVLPNTLELKVWLIEREGNLVSGSPPAVHHDIQHKDLLPNPCMPKQSANPLCPGLHQGVSQLLLVPFQPPSYSGSGSGARSAPPLSFRKLTDYAQKYHQLQLLPSTHSQCV